MFFRLLRLGIVIAVFIGVSGCPSPVYQKKTPEPNISEEDISGPGSQPRSEEQSSTATVPPAPPVEGGPSVVDPGARQPRKFRRDRQGRWESSSEGSGSKEP